MSESYSVHGTGLVLGVHGILLRGPSGAGKSLLALSLIDTWVARGFRAVLVADDRLDLEVGRARLVMRAPEPIAGLIELRGRGIVNRPHLGRAPLHLVVDLVPDLVRMPEEREFSTDLFGIVVPRAPVPQAGVAELGHQQMLVAEALRALSTTKRMSRQKTT